MRKVTFGGANSLDNYIARSVGTFDWFLWSDVVSEMMKDLWSGFDTMVMGRKTWDVAMANAPAAGKKTSANPYGDMKTYVFSRTLDAGQQDGVIVVNSDPGEFVRDLKTKAGKGICIMGGGDLARSLLEAGVIDEIGFNIHPVLLGTGIPLFHPMKRRIDLDLIECRQLKNGCVYVLYRVKN
jgi:dihydrofolate reductase